MQLSIIEHLSTIFWSGDWRNGRLSAFTVAFDASGASDQPIICVAGFVASPPDWIAFERAWNDRLAVDGIKYFQMNQFVNCSGQFSGWENKKGDGKRLLEELVDIIKSNVYRKFGCVVVAKFINQIEAKNRDAFMTTKAYALAGRGSASGVAKWAGETERLSYRPELVFEDGDFGKGELIDGLKQDGWPYPTFRPKIDTTAADGTLTRGFVPVQAADLIAHTYFTAAREIETSRDGRFARHRRYSEFEAISGNVGRYSPQDISEMNRLTSVVTSNPANGGHPKTGQ
jgi:hypothetical protein